MTRLVAAELFKLRTTRTFAAMVGATFALLLLLVVLSLALTDNFHTETTCARSSPRRASAASSCWCSGWWRVRASTGTGPLRRRCSSLPTGCGRSPPRRSAWPRRAWWWAWRARSYARRSASRGWRRRTRRSPADGRPGRAVPGVRRVHGAGRRVRGGARGAHAQPGGRRGAGPRLPLRGRPGGRVARRLVLEFSLSGLATAISGGSPDDAPGTICSRRAWRRWSGPPTPPRSRAGGGGAHRSSRYLAVEPRTRSSAGSTTCLRVRRPPSASRAARTRSRRAARRRGPRWSAAGRARARSPCRRSRSPTGRRGS